MGLFSSKTVITTGTSISPFLGQKPNLVRDAVIRATLNDWPKTPVILDALISGYNVDPEGYYNYGKDEYSLGLPTSTLYSLEIDENQVTIEASRDFGGSVFLANNDATVTDIGFGSIPLLHATYKALRDVFRMNDRYSTPYQPTGFGILHDNYQLLGKDISTQDVYFDSLGAIDYDNTTLTVNLYSVDKGTVSDNREDFSYMFTSMQLLNALDVVRISNQVYLAKVEYTYSGNANPPPYTGSFTHYFMYDPQTGSKPQLPYYTGDSLNSPYYPIGLVRVSKQFLVNQNTREDVNNLLNYLGGTKLESLEEALADNPDLNKIDNTFVTLGLPIGRNFDVGRRKGVTNIYESDNTLLKYLYYYFEHLDAIGTVTRQEFEDSLDNPDLPPKLNTLRISDSTYRTDLYWNYVVINATPFGMGYDRNKTFELGISYTLANEHNRGEDNYYNHQSISVVRHHHDTRTVSSYTVYGLFTVSGVYPGKDVITSLYDAIRRPLDEDDAVYDGFFLPLHRDTMLRLSKAERTYVGFASTILVNYAIDKQKIKWYERGAFLTLIRIIAVIVSIYTMNPSVGAAASTIASQIAVMVLEQVLISLIIAPLLSFALKEIADMIGGDLGELIAVVVLAVAIAYGANQGYDIPFADALAKSTTTLTDISMKDLRADYLEFQKEVKVFESEYRNLVAELEAAQSLLGESGINPIWFNGLNNTLVVETPTDYYNRALDTDVSLSNDLLTNFYSNHLTLGA